ncbi:PRC-barrel domain-containing protein [Halovulum dunhuangense]|uniref:PRC-barrel domain-containing protein n=1 Tax=Halovulum dunhuangense TaxID=1505036 RepID=A0A849L1R7_9RHOB|nr:PRC-barrel domain-containing protein [Halovulum dunhuangense]NNU80210.1 PRC-barrel domain-containing protein [Halovulum dunhuangense]
MKRLTLTTALALPLIAAPILAQDAIVENMDPVELRGDWIIGSTVTSPQEETIGSIVDVVFDQEEGRINAAIVSVGGFLGFGAKQIAVDWQELQIDYDGNDVTLDLTREEAELAPEYAFRDRQSAPAPEPMMDGGTTGTGGMGGGTGGL